MQQILKVTETRNAIDKAGVPYQVVKFESFKVVDIMGTSRTIATGKSGTRILRPERTITTGQVIKADTFYGCQVGDLMEGTIERFNTTPYEVNERTVFHYSCVVFANENGVTYANNQLKVNNACVVDEHGQPTVKLNSYKVAAALSETAEEDEGEEF